MLPQRPLLLIAGIYIGLACSSYTPIAVATSTVISCSYKSGSEPGGVAPTPIPTVEKTNTISTTQIHNATVPSTVTVAVDTTVTVTQVTATEYAFSDPTVTVPTSTIGAGTIFTVATAIFTETVCDDGAEPVIVTELTPSTTVATPETTTTTRTVSFSTSTAYLTYVTVTASSYTPVVSTTTTTASCGETVTRTLAAQCAPTNLIGSIDGQGLLPGKYAGRSSVAYARDGPWAEDPSLCCQACVDNKNCAASESLGGACGLFYLAAEDGEPVCDAPVFSLTLSCEVIPGQGVVAQSGCDTVGYDVSDLKLGL
ncbi:hypothetical protein F4861DRAFT_551443 [Xylaria intraflava]|nr:hypothetical protein F4861DRAFT_551443 [Xylaria intraflava]